MFYSSGHIVLSIDRAATNTITGQSDSKEQLGQTVWEEKLRVDENFIWSSINIAIVDAATTGARVTFLFVPARLSHFQPQICP